MLLEENLSQGSMDAAGKQIHMQLATSTTLAASQTVHACDQFVMSKIYLEPLPVSGDGKLVKQRVLNRSLTLLCADQCGQMSMPPSHLNYQTEVHSGPVRNSVNGCCLK